jgi:hypothetical protein
MSTLIIVLMSITQDAQEKRAFEDGVCMCAFQGLSVFKEKHYK